MECSVFFRVVDEIGMYNIHQVLNFKNYLKIR